jgi:predicted amidohydrolase
VKGELRVALLQTPLVWEDPEANRNAIKRRIALIPGATDLIVLPEMFTTGFTMSPDEIDKREGLRTIEWMREQASVSGAAICGSIAFAGNGHYYNRLAFISPEGQEVFYDKRHTFTLVGEQLVYTSGKSRQIIDFRGFRICPLICYDLRFPVWSRNTDGYDLLVYVANWPAARVQAWDALLKARAIENMAFCAGVNRIGTDANGHSYSGHSAVYDAMGNRLAYSEEEGLIETTLVLSQLHESREKFKFLDDRDHFTLAP